MVYSLYCGGHLSSVFWRKLKWESLPNNMSLLARMGDWCNDRLGNTAHLSGDHCTALYCTASSTALHSTLNLNHTILHSTLHLTNTIMQAALHCTRHLTSTIRYCTQHFTSPILYCTAQHCTSPRCTKLNLTASFRQM